MAHQLALKVPVEDSGAYEYSDAHAAGHHAYNLPSIEALIPEGNHKILDAGCGSGSVSGWLSSLGHDVWGCDPSESGVAMASKAHPKAKFFTSDLVAGGPDVVPVGGYDGIVSVEVVEHLYDPDQFLKNLYGAVRPGGFLILTTPYHGYIKNLAISLVNGWDNHFMTNSVGGHIKFYSPKTIARTLRDAGFEVVKTTGSGRLPLLWCSMQVLARKPL